MDFKKWESTIQSTHTIMVSRDVVRDVYPMPNGINLMQDVCFPSNPFKTQWERTVVCYTLKESERENVKLAGGALSDAYYTEDGYGTPLFCGDDSLERAFNFAMKLKLIKK